MIALLSSVLDVSVDFDTSHLYFPKIVITLMVILGIFILATRHKEIAIGLVNLKKEATTKTGFKFWKLALTLTYLVSYFVLMQVLSDIFPNTGYGFLITTIPFIFLLSFIYTDEVTKKTVIIISVNSILSPLIAWYVLGNLFGITLP